MSAGETESESLPYRPLGAAVRWSAVALLVLGVASLVVPVARFGESPRYQLSRDQARAASDAFLKSQGLDPPLFSTSPIRPPIRAVPMRSPASISSSACPWRSLCPLRAQSPDTGLDDPLLQIPRPGRDHRQHPSRDRQGHRFGHTVPETRPGADITPEHAREIADQFAASWTGIRRHGPKESSTEIKKARRDHSLEWEARPGDPRNVDETRWRVEINLAGDRVVSARGFWKLPEAWQRGRERENALAITLAVLRIVTLAGLIVYGMWLLIQGTRHGIVRWHAAIRLALPATLLFPSPRCSPSA